MTLSRFARPLASSLYFFLFFLAFAFFPMAVVRAQGVVSCAAPAETINGAYVTVNGDQAQVNVRSGPNSYLYGKVGVLFTYESAPAVGRSPGGEWIQISCPAAYGGSGWVYAANVTLTAPGDLPVVDIPVTATPLATSTVDPALAAAFPPVQTAAPRLPTFTPAAPLQTLPVFTDASQPPSQANANGVFIVTAFALGMAVLAVSFFVKR